MKVVPVTSLFFLVILNTVFAVQTQVQQASQASPLDMLEKELTAALQQAKQVIAGVKAQEQAEIQRTGQPGQSQEIAMELVEELSAVVSELRGTLAEFQAELPILPPSTDPVVTPQPAQQQSFEELQNLSLTVFATLEQVKQTLTEVKGTLEQIQNERAALQLSKGLQNHTLLTKAKQYYPYPQYNQQNQNPYQYNPYYAEQQADMMSDMAEYQQDMAEAAYERAFYQDYLDRMKQQQQQPSQPQPQAQTQVLKKQMPTEQQMEAMEEQAEMRQEQAEMKQEQRELRQEQREMRREYREEKREARQEAAMEAQQAAAEYGQFQPAANSAYQLKINTLTQQYQPYMQQQPNMNQGPMTEAALEAQEAQMEHAADMAELQQEQQEIAAEAAAIRHSSNPPAKRSKTSTFQIIINISLAVIVLGIAILILAKRNQGLDKKKKHVLIRKKLNSEFAQINV